MNYSKKSFVQLLSISTLVLLPIYNAASNELSGQLNQMQTDLLAANEKIAALLSDQKKITGMMNVLQTGLNTTNVEINNLKTSPYKTAEFKPTPQRTANGHGR